MYNNILVAIAPDHDEKQEDALIMATRLAKNTVSEITALTVIEPVPAYIGIQLNPDDYSETAGTRAMASLRHFAGDLSDVRTVVLHGRPGQEIVDYAERHNIDCIVLASHKPGLSDYFLGSTAARVVRHAPCSVHVMR